VNLLKRGITKNWTWKLRLRTLRINLRLLSHETKYEHLSSGLDVDSTRGFRIRYIEPYFRMLFELAHRPKSQFTDGTSNYIYWYRPGQVIFQFGFSI
jgi:hypothetical protein